MSQVTAAEVPRYAAPGTPMIDRIEWVGGSKIAPVIGPPEMVWATLGTPVNAMKAAHAAKAVAHAAKAIKIAEFLIGLLVDGNRTGRNRHVLVAGTFRQRDGDARGHGGAGRDQHIFISP